MPRKRNASGAGSIRQRSDGRWEARITVGTDPGTGKPIRRSIYGNTQKEVLVAMRDAQKSVDDGLYIEPTRLTLAQWLDIWQRDYLLSQKYGTVKTYRAQIATHIKPALGAVKLSKLTPHLVQGFYNDLLARGRTVPKRDEAGKIIKKDGIAVTETAPLNAKTVRNIHGVLTKALSQAVKLGYIARNPCDMVDLPRVEKTEIVPLTDAQVKAYLAATDGDTDYGDMLKVILFTGLREAEALGLTWDCVDFDRETLKICKQLQKRPAEAGGFQFASLKNDRTRILHPAPFVMGILRAVRKKQAARRLLAGGAWQDWQDAAKQYAACRLVFTNALGDHLHPQRLYDHHKKIAREAGAPNARVHDLRHPYVKHTTKIFSLRLMDFQAQAYPDARRKTRGACQLHRGGQSQSSVRPFCNRTQFPCLPPQSKISRILYAISIRLSGYTSTRSISSSASSVVSVSASKIALDASLRLSCRVCSSCFCFACANTAA